MTPAPNATGAAGELLPCPFCGGPASARPVDDSERGVYGFVVSCEGGCGVDLGPHDDGTAAEAIAVWNRRAPLPPAVVNAGTLAEWREITTPEGIARMLRTCWDHETAARSYANTLSAALDALAAAAQPARAVPSDRETKIVETMDAELASLMRHANDVANSSQGGAAETEWANGVDYAVKAMRQALDLASYARPE